MRKNSVTQDNQNAGFVAGTLVHTDKGLVPIQDIKVGDLVLSKPESCEGKAEYKPVLNTFKSVDKQAVGAVSYYHKTGLNYLMCTENHQLWVTKQPNDSQGGWIDTKNLPPGCLYSVHSDEVNLDDYSVMPVRTLPYFPEGGAYTHRIEEHDSWQYDGDTYDVMYLQFNDENYHFISLSADKNEQKNIREEYGKLEAIEPQSFIGESQQIEINSKLFQKLSVLLEQDIDINFRSIDIFLKDMHSPFIVNGNVVKEDSIFDKGLFDKALRRLEEYGVDMGADYGESVHLSMERYDDECPNPYKAHVYNLEVADYHTYFVGHDGIWAYGVA